MLTRGHERRLISTTPSASCCDRVVAKLTPYLRASSLRASRPPPRTGNHYNEIGDGAAEAILLNFAAPDCSAPTRQGIKRTSLKCRRERTPEPPDAVLARPLSLPSYPVATGRPRPGHQRPRALRLIKEVNAGPRKTINLNYPLSQLVRSGRGEADPVAESVAAAASNRKSLQRNRRRRRRSHTSQLRRARLFGPHAPRDKENQPEMPERKNAGAPRCCFGATPLVAALPRSNGQASAWPSASSRAKADKRG